MKRHGRDESLIFKRRLLLIVFSLIFAGTMASSGWSQTASDEDVYRLSEVAVTATRGAKEVFETPNSISVLGAGQLERQQAQIAPLELRETVGVFAQQTTHGQGSPILRGLTGYQTYIQVDGVRLNNSTFRSGPNQYLASINAESLGRIEVLRGPGSVLYGSGAMGGVISVFTKSPRVPHGTNWQFSSRIQARGSSADRERMGHVELSGGRGRLGFLLSGGTKSVGDIWPGRGYDVQLSNKKFYLTSEKPSVLPEGARLVDLESPVAWDEYSGNAKLVYQLSDAQIAQFAYQMVRQPEVPRYDKLVTREFERFVFSPQNRDLFYTKYTGREIAPLVEQLDATLSLHRQKEGRKEVKRDSTQQRERFDTVQTLGFSLQARSPQQKGHRLTTGGEFYLDTLASSTVKTDLATDQQTVDDTWGRFPDGARFWDLNLFAQDEIQVLERLELTLGGHYTRFSTEADLSVRDPSFGVFSNSDTALTGSAGLVFHLTDTLNLVGNVANSFRAPSLNDTTAVEVTNEGVDAPSPDLHSERGMTAEGGLKVRSRYFTGTLTYYFSRISDLVTRVPVEETYAGQTMPKIYRDIQTTYPDLEVFVRDNIDEAEIQGIELTGLSQIHEAWSLFGNLTWTDGQVTLLNGGIPDPNKPWEARIRREPPLNGLVGVRWESAKHALWTEFFARGAVKQDRLSRGDIRDPRIPGFTRDPTEVTFDADGHAVDAGTPGWFTLNLRGGVRIAQQTRLILGIENLLNRRYREHSSGVDAPGFNLILSLDTRI